MYLQEFDLIYTCQKVIKGYIIVDMLVEAPCDTDGNRNELVVVVEQCEDKSWILLFYASKCLQRVGKGIV